MECHGHNLQFIRILQGKIVTTASVKFNEEKFDYLVINDTAYSYPKDDRDIIFNMLCLTAPSVALLIVPPNSS